MELGEVDARGAEAGHGERRARRVPRRLEVRDVGAVPHRQRIGALPDARHPDGRALGREHDGGRAVRDRAAVQQAQRVGHHAALHHLLERHRLLEVRVGVAGRVRVILHRHLGDLARAHAPSDHQRARHQPGGEVVPSLRVDRDKPELRRVPVRR